MKLFHQVYFSALLSVVLLLTSPLVFAANSPKVLSAFVLYAQDSDLGETVNIARVIVDGEIANCDDLPLLEPFSNYHLRKNPDPNNFPISVCETLYLGGKTTVIGDFNLPAVKRTPKTLAVIGDSGYKAKQIKEFAKPKWQFPNLLSDIVQQKPDVVMHMGDYNYVGTPGNIKVNGVSVSVYDAGDNTTQGMCKIPGAYYGQNSVGSDSPDTWSAWQSSLFDPAKAAFATAPWVFARGNHELCSRAGIGWFYLLDSNSPLLGKYAAQLSCPAAENPTPLVFTPPFLLDLSSLNLVVLDSANACDSGLLNHEDYINQFGFIKQLIHNAKNNTPAAQQTWIQSHRPFWGVDKLDAVGSCGDDPDNEHCFITQTLQSANQHTLLSEDINLVVSGHMHRYQVVSFKDLSHPQQLVVGNGGVTLGKMHPKQTTEMDVNGKVATIIGYDNYGYMLFNLDGKEWHGDLRADPASGNNLSVQLKCQSNQYPLCQ